MPSLFDPLRLGALSLPNRVLMAPLTRGRATKEGVPTAIMAEYYRQRASAGLIISEGTGISREGLGWAYAPGIWNDAQVEGWTPVVKAVHEAEGRIFCQLWHEGRLVHPAYNDGKAPVSSSATKADGEVPTYDGTKPYAEARPLAVDEMPRLCADYARATRNALAAGFDGVEIHSANGYLLDEFLRDSTNKRTDAYGGSIANRIRLLTEVVRAVVDVAGADRTGVRLSPNDEIFGVVDSDPGPLFEAAAKALSEFGLAYLHVREPKADGTFGKAKFPPIAPRMKAAFNGVFILNADYDGPKGQAALDAGEADAIAYGRTFLANPDLPRRIEDRAALNKDDKATWYTQGTEGYLDYPTLDDPADKRARRPLRYAPEIEHAAPDEAEAIAGIIAAMTEQSEIVAGRQHHAVRASHAKSTGVVTGELVVQPNLPPELAQGLFAEAGTFKVAVRFAQGPGEILPDKISTHRGMAIKVFGVEGEKLPGHGDDTQDFVLATGTVFPSGTAQQFLKDEKQILATTKAPESLSTGIKAAVSNVAQAVTGLVGGSGSPKADFFGHPPTHPLSDSYYSQAPIRFGEHVAKLGAFPTAPDMKAMAGKTIDVGDDPDGFRHAVVAFFRDHDVHFDLRAQLWTNADSQPIEDTSVEWPESESAYVTVATLELPRQDAYSAERQRFFDDVLSFRPAHALAAHRPLGSVMRARLKVYQALSDVRHKANGAPHAEPAGPADIPAWTIEHNIVEAAGARFHVARTGSGPALLLLHGWPEFWLTWEPVMHRLADSFTLLAPDLRGFGASDKPAGPWGNKEHAADMLSLLDALGLEQVGVVGHDVGGGVMQPLAREAPERFSGLFLFDFFFPQAGPRAGTPDRLIEIWYQSFHLLDLAPDLVGSSRDACRAYIGHFLRHWSHNKHAFDDVIETFVDNFLAPGNLLGGFQYYRGAQEQRLAALKGDIELPPAIEVPTCVRWGAHDPVLPVAWTDAVSEMFADLDLAVLPDVGHFPHREDPDGAARQIRGFFQQIGWARGR